MKGDLFASVTKLTVNANSLMEKCNCFVFLNVGRIPSSALAYLFVKW